MLKLIRVWLFAMLGMVVATFPAWSASWNPLPDTGQTKCYDTSGKEMTCPVAGQPLYGQDAQHQGVAPSYSTTTNSVTDNNTGLVWMKSDDGTTRTWQGAVDYCNGLNYAGQIDWRLPTILELKSIVDYGRTNPAINPAFSCRSDFYWSATACDFFNPTHAWFVDFNGGSSNVTQRYFSNLVRCVRAGL